MVSEHTARHQFSANLLAYTFSQLLRDGIARDRFKGDVGVELGEAASDKQHHDSKPEYLNPRVGLKSYEYQHLGVQGVRIVPV